MGERMRDRIVAVKTAKGRFGVVRKVPTIASRMVCLTVCACVVLLAGFVAEMAQGQVMNPTPPLTPPPPGRSYDTDYPSGAPYSPGYPYGSSYDARYRDRTTGRFGASLTPDTSGVSPPSSRYSRPTPRGRTTPTPRGATPTPRGATPTAAVPGQGPASSRFPGQPPTVVRGAMPAAPAARAAAAKAPGGTASFTFKPAPDVAVLYTTPFQAKTAVGEECETRVSLSNPGKKEFQTIVTVLRFDPDAVEPVRLDEDPISPLLESPSESVVYTQAGILIYQAQLARPMKAEAADFFTIRWKTLAVSPHTEIGFGSWRGQRTALLGKSNETILGGPGNEGSLGMTLQVYSPDEIADGPPIGEELFAGRQRTTRGGVQLKLITNKKEIPANEDFYVGVWFDNPRLLEISKVTLKIRFDPRVLEVVDDDTNNWITIGINISDGDYHSDFPFDVHVENSVLNDLGAINYAVACTQRRSLPEQGYLARIRFRPKGLAASTPIEFVLEPDDDPMRTQVCYLGDDVLGSPDRNDDGVENLTVTIVEPRLPRLLTTEK